MEEFDVVIIGGGTAGIAAARSAIESGARVGLVEANRTGGHSLFRGQLPLQIIQNQIGKSDDSISLANLVQEVKQQEEVIAKEIEEGLKNSGVNIIKGEGSLQGSHQVSVTQDGDPALLQTGKIIIATGSLPKPVGRIPFDDQSIFHIDQLLDLEKSPASLLIVGGDKSGLEAAHLFNLLGIKVFLVDQNHRLIHDRDPDLIAGLEAGFKQQKIKTLLGKRIISIFKDAEKIDITLDGGVKFSTEKVLVSGERLGNTTPLGLSPLDIELGTNKEIWVNENMETSLKDVFAVGSVTGRSRSLQISREEGRVAGANAAGGSETVDQSLIPFCLDTKPEIASIGCLSGDAHYKGYRAVQGRFDFSGWEGSDTQGGGFCKIVADRESKKFIGAQILGVQAAAAMAQLQDSIREGIPVNKLTQIRDEPSLLEPIISAAKKCVQSLSARR